MSATPGQVQYIGNTLVGGELMRCQLEMTWKKSEPMEQRIEFCCKALRGGNFRAQLFVSSSLTPKTNAGPWSRLAATRDLPTIAFSRADPLLRRNGPVPGILAAYRPGAIMDKSERLYCCSFWVPPKPTDPYPPFYTSKQPQNM